jgi:hypothetical protein
VCARGRDERARGLMLWLLRCIGPASGAPPARASGGAPTFLQQEAGHLHRPAGSVAAAGGNVRAIGAAAAEAPLAQARRSACQLQGALAHLPL